LEVGKNWLAALYKEPLEEDRKAFSD